jgi:isoquinoline 1-oxidoreductase/isoquinoline 1-oxidoreductase beta subunit
VTLTRRELLRGALAGGALVIGASLAGCGGGGRARMIRHAEATGELAANAYVTILPTGVVVLSLHKAEIGQGISTAYATFVAEELEVEPGEIQIELADSLSEYRTTGLEGVPLFAMHATGGSTSTREGFLPIRRAAAAAREMLVGAAAAEWGVPASECAARAGRVHHDGSGRSAGYGELTRLAARRDVPGSPRLKPRAEFRLIGKHGARVDARAKVTGAAIYGIDVDVPGMVCAYPIHGPRFGARPREVRDGDARRARGVIDVIALDWGVAVVAEKYWQAERAARLVEVDWDDGATAGLDTADLIATARAHKKPGGAARSDGKVAAAYQGAAADERLDAIYEVPYLAHAPLEPQNCVASVARGKVEVWAPCQSPTMIQECIADAIGVDPEQVLVHTTYAGGGFGRRLLGDFAAQAAQIARKVGKPVKLIWSRASDMTQGFYRPAAITHVRGAIDRGKQRAVSLSFHQLSQPLSVDAAESVRGGQPTWVPGFVRKQSARWAVALTASNTAIDMFATEGARDTPYRIPNLRVEYTPIDTGIPVASWRSVGHSVNGFVIESAIDELAHAAGVDPLEFRIAHLAAGSRERRVLEAVAELAGWGGTPPDRHAWGLARHTAFGTECAEIAEVTVERGRIRVTRVWCAVDCGLVVNPDIVRAQLEGGIVFGLSAALDQAITVEDGVVQETNFDRFPSLRMHECPRIETTIADSEGEELTGVGEPAVPPIAPAVANALFALTGTRLRTMPLQRAYDQEVR